MCVRWVLFFVCGDSVPRHYVVIELAAVRLANECRAMADAARAEIDAMLSGAIDAFRWRVNGYDG
jgi:hypothetical protein